MDDAIEAEPREAQQWIGNRLRASASGRGASNFRLLRHLKSIVDLDAEIANSAFQLRMPE